jgi:predicted transcriptional regulator
MKTAISLPDELFAALDSLARELDVPRSRIVAEALAEYIDKHRLARVTEQLDAIYAESPAVNESVRRAQLRILKRSDW